MKVTKRGLSLTHLGVLARRFWGMKITKMSTRTDKWLSGLPFPIQSRAMAVGPPVRYRSQKCEDWCGLAVLYCRYFLSLVILC